MPVVTLPDIQKIRDLVGDHLGFSFSAIEHQRLEKTVYRELEHLNLDLVAEYLTVLQMSTIWEPVWQRLIVSLANPESYFFRDQSQFELLRSKILPELIQRRASEKTLKLWSAGCAAGEEVYSLAILLKELISDIDTWQITIFGTDINTEALAIAEKGEYGEFSLRLQDLALCEQHFTSDGDRHQIKPELRQFVEFHPLNLLDSTLPECFQDIDLILCRHVFIHLETQAIAKILAHFKQALRPDGYLITGHSELYGLTLTDFRAHIYAGSLIYQPQLEPQSNLAMFSLPSFTNLQWQSSPLPERGLKLSDPIFDPNQVVQYPNQSQSQLNTLIRHRRYAQAIALLEQQSSNGQYNFQTHYTLACLHAHLGQYPPAAHHCYQALELNHMSEPPCYLLAQIAMIQGEKDEAKRILLQILFFNTEAALAYYDLAQIYYLENDGEHAQSLEQKAFALLQDLDLDQVLDPFRQYTVQQLYDEINVRQALIS
ncbi:CheR family methyltransferase [[Leptolyngbya] sp. PCC 7376]|uniref:CheR family methyltransferase n=1 Tax=[Leptolyngbya] sp. PCC 7376 TaxID=111781 RepID=UPI001C1E6301|nr:CheR family methyltransferase [[Leptolyngbya] sp. PCC 7376]